MRVKLVEQVRSELVGLKNNPCRDGEVANANIDIATIMETIMDKVKFYHLDQKLLKKMIEEIENGDTFQLRTLGLLFFRDMAIHHISGEKESWSRQSLAIQRRYKEAYWKLRFKPLAVKQVNRATANILEALLWRIETGLKLFI